METLRQQQQQNTQLQGKITGLLEPAKLSQQQIWGSWIGSVSEGFHPLVLQEFYNESFNMVMKFMNKSRETQAQEAGFVPQQQQQQQPAFVPQQPAFVQPQQPAFVQQLSNHPL